MQLFIKDFYDSKDRCSEEYSDYILAIKDDFLIIKVGNKYTGKFVELFKESFAGWHNVRFPQDNYTRGSGESINIETDILIQDGDKYQVKQYSIEFIPLQTHSLDKLIKYLGGLNKNDSEETLRISNQVKLQQEEAKRQLKLKQREEKQQIELQLKKNTISNLIFQLGEIKELKVQELYAKKAEEERIKELETERQTIINNFTNKVYKLRENREIEKILLNYMKKYVKNKFLSPTCYISFTGDMLRDNDLYELVKVNFPVVNALSLDFYDSSNSKLEEIDKLIEFMNRTICESSQDCAKLLTWIGIRDVAMIYYSNYFYELYTKQIGDIDNLSLKDSILRYINSDILYDDEKIRGMFVYFLMSLGKFDEADLNKGYIYCIKIFEEIYRELKDESEYDRFINSLLVKEQSDEISYTIDDIDLMTGNEFEKFASELFKKMGFKTIITKASGDQGIDVIAEKGGVRYGIQAKCYSSYVSNSAIQEVVAGLTFYKCDKALVITNNYFSSSAIELANANEVILWDREMLKQKIAELY
jgi:HJR/Mrr/RecB family endonuclease